jgi:cytochrome P450
MDEMIAARRTAEKKEEKYDLFSSLLDASDEAETEGESKISDAELRGNIFIFMIAGHEVWRNTVGCTIISLKSACRPRHIHYVLLSLS